jgi:hypothetical protein
MLPGCSCCLGRKRCDRGGGGGGDTDDCTDLGAGRYTRGGKEGWSAGGGSGESDGE